MRDLVRPIKPDERSLAGSQKAGFAVVGDYQTSAKSLISMVGAQGLEPWTRRVRIRFPNGARVTGNSPVPVQDEDARGLSVRGAKKNRTFLGCR
jgi:hypothetical protein